MTDTERERQPDTTTHDSIPAKTGENDAYKTSCDCISRRMAIDYCYQLINVEHQQGSDEMNYGQERVNQTETILHHLELMPSVQPFYNITLTDVLKYIDDMSEDEWQEFTCCLECRGWELQRRTAKWCGGDFA